MATTSAQQDEDEIAIQNIFRSLQASLWLFSNANTYIFL